MDDDLDGLKILSFSAMMIPGAAEPPPRLDTRTLRTRRRAMSRAIRNDPADEVLRNAAEMEQALPQERKWLAYELVRFHAGAFAACREAQVAHLAAHAQSWYAIDALGTILAGPLWARGQVSDACVEGWARAESRWLRRLALVATVGRNGRPNAPDPARTLAVCRTLAADRDDMVEKAVSWALRFLAQRGCAAEVAAFVAEHDGELAARVRREVRHKLATGLKTPRNRNMVTVD